MFNTATATWPLTTATKGHIRQLIPIVILWALYGGLLRDSQETLISSIDFLSSPHTRLKVEIEVVCLCLQWYESKGYHMIREKVATWHLFNRIIPASPLLGSLGSSISHVFREGNMAADWISKYTLQGTQELIWDEKSADMRLIKLLRLEQIGSRLPPRPPGHPQGWP
ncbi:hypothetical protein LIER_31417 [Lithospermum erythrorhizon]|uniref:RNase H type-1 domain-containing protein n=1 Tax=Lithospermum erythrorhizon TaxID=34254 RepID=A0AAV3RT90_LITER